MKASPYLAGEDSALLRVALRSYRGDACLELGAGNGGNLVDLVRRFKVVVGTDLARPTMTDWKNRGADFLLADTASSFRERTFDLVAFNPPYLPSLGDYTIDGGLELETPKIFLAEALRVVKRNGTVVFLLNQDADLTGFQDVCSSSGFKMRRVLSKHLFYETLSVFEALAAKAAEARTAKQAD